MYPVNILYTLLLWAFLLFCVLTILNALGTMFKKRPFNESNNKSNLFFMFACNIQLLAGLNFYFNTGWFDHLKNLAQNRSNPAVRFYAMEHLSVMLLASVPVYKGRVMLKKAYLDV